MPEANILDIDTIEKRISTLEKSGGGANITLADEVSESGERAVKSSGIYKHIHDLEITQTSIQKIKLAIGSDRDVETCAITFDGSNLYSILGSSYQKANSYITGVELYASSISDGGFALLFFKNDKLVAVSDYKSKWDETGKDRDRNTLLDFTLSDKVGIDLSGTQSDDYVIVFIVGEATNIYDHGNDAPPAYELYGEYIGMSMDYTLKNMSSQNSLDSIIGSIKVYCPDERYSDTFYNNAYCTNKNAFLEHDYTFYDPSTYVPQFKLVIEQDLGQETLKKHAVYLTDAEEETLKKLLSAASIAINE